MKKIKFSVIALLAVISVTLSSCLGDGDSTYPIYGTGHVGGGFASQVVLDNGVKLNVTNVSSTDLINYDRVFIAGTITEEGYKGDAVSAGQTLTVEASQLGSLFESDWMSSEDALKAEYLSNFSGFNWFPYGGIGNGYMNFELVGTILYHKGDNNTQTVIEPTTYVYAKVDTQAKSVELMIGYDNHWDDYAKSDGSSELQDGYSYQSSVSFPVTVSMRSVYNQLVNAGLSDDTNVTFKFVKVYNSGSNNEVKTEELSLSYTTFQIAYLKNQY